MFRASTGSPSRRIASLLLLPLAVAGCVSTAHNAATTSDFLFPAGKDPVVSGTPVLSVPLSVGIAFVPADSGFAPQSTAGMRAVGLLRRPTVTESQKIEVMQMISERLRAFPFVRAVTIIPSDFLRPGGGFENIDQLRATYGVDTIALISYDQTQFSDEGALSLVNWTVIGAYVVPAQKNETETILDTTVFDIGSRRLLFRASGTSRVSGRATLVNQSEEARLRSEESLRKAAENLVGNLEPEVRAFGKKIEEPAGQYTIVRLRAGGDHRN